MSVSFLKLRHRGSVILGAEWHILPLLCRHSRSAQGNFFTLGKRRKSKMLSFPVCLSQSFSLSLYLPLPLSCPHLSAACTGSPAGCQRHAFWEHGLVWLCLVQRWLPDAWAEPRASHHRGEPVLPCLPGGATSGENHNASPPPPTHL